MALTRTTLASAVGVSDTKITVASATGIAAGSLLQIDQEMCQATKEYVSGVSVPVLRGVGGSKQEAHVITAGVVHGPALDFANIGPGGPAVSYPTVRPTLLSSVSATSTLVHAPAGCDHRVILNGTAVITLTIPVPTVDMDGAMLVVVSNGAAAHVITYTGGLGAAGSNYDVITNNATGQGCWVAFAANGAWCIPQAPGLTGTVTNITGGIA
jgi:hypothetical protein